MNPLNQLHQSDAIGRYKRLLPPNAVVIKARGDAPMNEIERLAGKLEPQLAKAILAGLQKMGADADLDLIVAALQSGDVSKVIAALAIDPKAAFSEVSPAIQSGLYASGAATAATIRLTGAAFAFDQLNPRLITWLQTYNLGLIRQISDSTKEAVRSVLVSGMTDGKNPKDVARQIKGIVGLTERQAKAVMNYRKELETFHLKRTAGSFGLGRKVNSVNGTQVTILDEDGLNSDGVNARRLRDFRYDGQLSRAVETGKPLSPEQIDKMVAAYQRKYLAYRSRTIARTEALRTTNMGVQDAWRQAIEDQVVQESLVRRQWVVAKDERLCEWCSPIPKMNPKRGVKLDQPFATPKGPVTLPPVHPNCRCTVFIRQWEPEQL
jgi:hypothetical protein